jgi:hypothetical protein
MSEDDARMPSGIVARIERDLSALRKRPTTLAEFIGLWKGFADDVGASYESGIFEFANYLSVRDHLAWIMENYPGAREIIGPELREIDDRFKTATQESPVPIQPLSTLTPERWWWYRWPLRYGRELADDLEREHGPRN